MTTIHEIKQLLWLDTPKGQGIAKFLIDNGPESDLQWVVFIHETKEIWTVSNWDVRAVDNWTLGRVAKKDKNTKPGEERLRRPIVWIDK